jgi:integrase
MEQGVWVVDVSPEAGSTKNSKARRVPLHPHLIEQGITKLAKARDRTPLFYREGVGNEVNPGYKMRASDLSDWVRWLGVTDLNVQPNHGWRHRFKTFARIAGIPEELADRIQGHAPRHQGGKYGKGPLPISVLLAEIEKMPWYDLFTTEE